MLPNFSGFVVDQKSPTTSPSTAEKKQSDSSDDQIKDAERQRPKIKKKPTRKVSSSMEVKVRKFQTFTKQNSPGDEVSAKSSHSLRLGLRRQSSVVSTKNSNLDAMESDYLYHLGLTKLDATEFSDVKYLVVGGTNDRMTKFAKQMATQLGVECRSVGLHKRYVIYKLGTVLVCSHGMGGPSISILLHELAKLLKYANADCVWIRIGTCGGLGIPAGTLVLTQQSLNGALEPWHETIVLGERVRRPTMFKPEMNLEIMQTCEELGLKAVIGKTMCCDDFYEGQARLDGAICDYNEDDKMKFLQRAHEMGVVNIEMESLQFGAFCHAVDVQAAVICVTILNRLEGDQVGSTPQELAEFEARPVKAVAKFIENDLKNAMMSADEDEAS